MIHDILPPYPIVCKKAEKLEGYGSHNYKIITKDQDTFVLKHYQDKTEAVFVEEENRILSAISGDLPYAVPLPQPANDGSLITLYPDNTFSRLLSFIPGTFLGEGNINNNLLYELGKAMGSLDQALARQESSLIKARRLHWDLQYCLVNRNKASAINDAKQKKLVDYFFDLFETFVLPKMSTMRHSLIHCDLNDWNILVSGDDVTGIIDFGDLSYSPVIHELAIALAYILLDKEDPIETALPVIQGYHETYHLLNEEIKLLYYLIPARLATSVCNSAEAKLNQDDTQYILISEKPAWKLLERWIAVNPIQMTNRFLQACSMKPIDYTGKRVVTLEKRRRFTGRSLGLSYEEPIHMQGAAFQYMFDSKGDTYLDLYNNVPHVGHCHPLVSRAISHQIRRLNTNTRYLDDALADYSEKLLSYFPDPLNKIFYVNSGSAATDLALRMAQTFCGRNHHLVLEHGYHGNTLKGITVSSYKFDGKGGNGPGSDITKLPLPNLFNSRIKSGIEFAEDARQRIQAVINSGKLPGAMIAEPISGCGGQVPVAPGYFISLLPFLKMNHILLIMDEVQTGFGRLGSHFWGFEQHGIVPDLVVLGKPMGNGHPVAAVVTTTAIADAFANGMEFFSSFGGNPVSMSAAAAVLEVMEQESLQAHARNMGDHLIRQLTQMQSYYPCIGDVRGTGLFLGLEFITQDGKHDTSLARRVASQLKTRCILTGTDGPFDNVLKIKPPLCVYPEDLDRFCNTLDLILKCIYSDSSP